MDQNLLGWNEITSMDPLWQENDFNIYVGVAFPMHYCIKWHSYVDIRIHFSAGKIQEHENIQKTLNGWSFCILSVTVSTISMLLLKNSMWNMF